MHDVNEREAMYAIMNAAASRGKGKNGRLPDVKDLYKRPGEQDAKSMEEKVKEVEDMQQHTSEWLAQFDLESLTREEEETASKEYEDLTGKED